MLCRWSEKLNLAAVLCGKNSNLLKKPTFRSISRNFHLKFPQDVHFVGCSDCSHRFLGATPTHHLPPLILLPSNSSVVPGTFRTGLSGWGPTTPVKRRPPQVDRVSNWKRPWNSWKLVGFSWWKCSLMFYGSNYWKLPFSFAPPGCMGAR